MKTKTKAGFGIGFLLIIIIMLFFTFKGALASEGITMFDNDNNIMIYENVQDQAGNPCIGCTVNLTIFNTTGTINQSFLLSQYAPGVYNQTIGKLPTGVYPVKIFANTSTFNGTSDRTVITVVDRLTSDYNSMLEFMNNSISYMNGSYDMWVTYDAGDVIAGYSYATDLELTSYGRHIVPDSTPTISLFDSTGASIVTSANMQYLATGIYNYSYTVAGGANTRVWLSEITAVYHGITQVKRSRWEVISSPAEVRIEVTDATIPTISCRINITNEGVATTEYQYRWWLANTIDCVYGDMACMVDSGSAAKLIDPGVNFITDKSLTLNVLGNHWCKTQVFWGSEYSLASDYFVSLPTEFFGGGGGGGGGGGSSVNPYLFNLVDGSYKVMVPSGGNCSLVNMSYQIVNGVPMCISSSEEFDWKWILLILVVIFIAYDWNKRRNR